MKRGQPVKTRLGDGVVFNMEIADVRQDNCIYTGDFTKTDDYPDACIRYGVKFIHLETPRYFRRDELQEL